MGAVIVPDSKLTPAGLQAWLVQETARYAPVIDQLIKVYEPA